VGVGTGELEAIAVSVNVAVCPLGSAGSAGKLKVSEVPGGLGELEAETDDVPGTWPSIVREVKIPGVVDERLIELIVIVLPLLLVTVNVPALDMVDPRRP
jgi:hypothetical protein